MSDPSQTRLLRIAAFLVDALAVSILLVLPSSLVSYGMTWMGVPRAIQLVWWAALAVLLVFMLLRDGYRGRSMGKRLLGLQLATRSGKPCGYGRSLIRNLPLLVPAWNLVELTLVVAGRSRTGDRIAGTNVVEE